VDLKIVPSKENIYFDEEEKNNYEEIPIIESIRDLRVIDDAFSLAAKLVSRREFYKFRIV
jgi:hypothetical protein